MDPRIYQVLFLATLLTAGALLRDFSIRPSQVALCFAGGLAAQAWFIARRGLPWRSLLSAAITCFSLSIILRSEHLWVHPLAALTAITAKFALRWRGKHLFNPGNLGVILGLTCLPGTWVSGGQWGQDVALAAWFVGLGMTVTRSARRMDISLAFLAWFLGLCALRVALLGQRWAVLGHRCTDGALLLFAFFMISDPMTVPNHPRARWLYAGQVALGAFFWQFHLYRTNALLWSLFLSSFTVPLWDLGFPASKFEWSRPAQGGLMVRRFQFKSALPLLCLCMMLAGQGEAFCGFYVGKADAKLYNKASQVALVRDGERTVISMLADYEGDLSDFALVVPVPTVLAREQVHVGDKALFERLDAYSAPRLVEYFDADPCPRWEKSDAPRAAGKGSATPEPRAEEARERDRTLGVTVEDLFTVGEYDIVILSAKESDGLETWLHENGYRVPAGARRALKPYIRTGTKFFVAKVNLEEQARTGLTYLRPLQMAFETPKYMLPVRLGMVNGKGAQDLIVYALSRQGRVETVNYRPTRVPTGDELPEYLQRGFADFYKAMFDRFVEREGAVVATEYVWNMAGCDPCAADPLTVEEQRRLGVMWEGPVVLTRLHVRYSPATFPEDLVFQATQDHGSFQARYVIRHPWQGSAGECPQARAYLRELRDRREREARTLAHLTGWNLNEIRRKAGLGWERERPDGDERPADPVKPADRWWDRLWKGAGA